MISSRDPDALFSGGGISFLTGTRTIKFNYGYSSFKGERPSMEDFYETSICEVDGQMVAFFGVFDGHGGSRTAEYLKKNLFKNLSAHPDFIKDTKTAICMKLLKFSLYSMLGNAMILFVYLDQVAFFSAILGPFSQKCHAVPLSNDHKPDRCDERQRIEEADGFIIWAGTWRVGGVLAVSRALGDKQLKPYVTAEREIHEEDEIDSVDFIIIASDGLWNVLSNKVRTFTTLVSFAK
ncbi:hypothetical protein PTKIN_Ptkin09bG0168700 [Pterospermum kingtungense]